MAAAGPATPVRQTRLAMILMMKQIDGINTGTWQFAHYHFVSQMRYFLYLK
jgi:hypothetical protein